MSLELSGSLTKEGVISFQPRKEKTFGNINGLNRLWLTFAMVVIVVIAFEISLNSVPEPQQTNNQSKPRRVVDKKP